MSETSTLIPCTATITGPNVPTPPATTTHVPIPRHAVVEGLVETIFVATFGVLGEEFAVSKDRMEMFGAIDLELKRASMDADLRSRSGMVEEDVRVQTAGMAEMAVPLFLPQ